MYLLSVVRVQQYLLKRSVRHCNIIPYLRFRKLFTECYGKHVENTRNVSVSFLRKYIENIRTLYGFHTKTCGSTGIAYGTFQYVFVICTLTMLSWAVNRVAAGSVLSSVFRTTVECLKVQRTSVYIARRAFWSQIFAVITTLVYTTSSVACRLHCNCCCFHPFNQWKQIREFERFFSSVAQSKKKSLRACDFSMEYCKSLNLRCLHVCLLIVMLADVREIVTYLCCC